MGKEKLLQYSYMPSRFVHMVLYKILQNTQIKECRVKYRNQNEYIMEMYGWVDEFIEGANNLKYSDYSAWDAYLTDVFRYGLFKLVSKPLNASERKTNSENKRENTTSEYARARVGRRFRDYIKIENTDNNRKIAANYLKTRCVGRLGRDPISTINDMISKVLDELDKRNLLIPYQIFEEYRNTANTIDDFFEIWAAILIYANRGYVPENELPEMRPQPVYNIFMASKKKIQDTVPLKDRCNGAQRIVLVNFAGTSFLANQNITHEVDRDWARFFYNLCLGGTQVRIVLTEPSSSAAADAIRYKMRPLTLNNKVTLDKIIPRNLVTLQDFVIRYPNADVEVRLTDISLPCAYMKSEFQDSIRDNIKVDLYLPSFGSYKDGKLISDNQSDDLLRQSFMVYRCYQPELYEVFSRNIEDIFIHSTPAFSKEN